MTRGEIITDDGERFPAYQIGEPGSRASEFLGSKHIVTYRFPQKQDYAVYSFADSQLRKIHSVPASAVVGGGGYTEIPELNASAIEGQVTYVFLPEGMGVDGFTPVGAGVEAASLINLEGIQVTSFRYDVEATVPDTTSGFPFGPATHENVYGQTRQYEIVRDEHGRIGAVWQDYSSWVYWVSWFDDDLTSFRTIELPRVRHDEQLAAATSDHDGNIYYLSIQAGDGTGGSSGYEQARNAALYKVSSSGQQINRTVIDTSPEGLNVAAFDNEPDILNGPVRMYSGADLEYSGGVLGLIFSRTMHRASDGLNHQGAIAVVFDAETLEVVKNHGQTSGHSFDNALYPAPDGGFFGADIGDNYPRGVHLHRFTGSERDSRVVFTFKTAHGKDPVSPAGRRYPLYQEISGDGETFYKWSNDNRTYSELGGVAKQNGVYTVVFASERSPDGGTLNNSRVGDYLNDARNIGLVRVRSDFATKWETPNVVSDDLILSAGLTETGGFYDFGGQWQPQRNTGVLWLTDYQDPSSENASRVKTASLPDGSLLILWEKWSAYAYIETFALRVDPYGKKLGGPFALGSGLRLHRRDDPLVVGDSVVLMSGSKPSGTIAVNVIEVY